MKAKKLKKKLQQLQSSLAGVIFQFMENKLITISVVAKPVENKNVQEEQRFRSPVVEDRVAETSS